MKEIPDQIVLDEDETWPDYKVADLARLLHMGASMSTLKKQLHTSPRAILDRIERYQLPPVRDPYPGTSRRWHTFTESDVAEIRQMRDDGVPNAEIVAKYGISLASLDNLRARYGLGKKTTKFTLGKRVNLKYDALSEAEIDEVAELCRNRTLVANICELFNISPKVVYRVAKYRGVKFEPGNRYRWTEAEREHLQMLAARKAGAVEIADELGMDKETVKREAARMGLELPNRYAVRARNFAAKYAEIDPQVLRLRKAGMMISEIVAETGLTIGMVNASIARLVAAGLVEPLQTATWNPKRDDVIAIARGYKLHLRPITIAMRIGADSEHSILRVAREEAIVHPCFGRPQFHVLRPEVLLHHLFDARLDKHLDDVETVFRRSLNAEDIDRALSRFDRARKEFPELTPWGHPDIRPRAAEMRARDRNAQSERARPRTSDVKHLAHV